MIDREKFKTELLTYEMPTIAEFIGFEWGQNLMANYLAFKVNRKLARYEKRKQREEFIKSRLA